MQNVHIEHEQFIIFCVVNILYCIHWIVWTVRITWGKATVSITMHNFKLVRNYDVQLEYSTTFLNIGHMCDIRTVKLGCRKSSTENKIYKLKESKCQHVRRKKFVFILSGFIWHVAHELRMVILLRNTHTHKTHLEKKRNRNWGRRTHFMVVII